MIYAMRSRFIKSLSVAVLGAVTCCQASAMPAPPDSKSDQEAKPLPARRDVEEDHNDEIATVIEERKIVTDSTENGTEVTTAEATAQPKIWLGIALKDVSGDLAQYMGSTKGVLVNAVFRESPAEEVKMQVGDILVKFQDVELTDPTALVSALLEYEKAVEKKQSKEINESKDKKQASSTDSEIDWGTVKVEGLRRGEKFSVELKPVRRPDNPEVAATTIDPKKQPELIERLLSNYLDTQNGPAVKLYRFGMTESLKAPAQIQTQNRTGVISHSENGKLIEIRIEEQAGHSPKFSLKESDGKFQEISRDELDRLPEPVRKRVDEFLEQRLHSIWIVDGNGAAGFPKGIRVVEVQSAMADSKKDGQKTSDQPSKSIKPSVPPAAVKVAEERVKSMREQIQQSIKERIDSKEHATLQGAVTQLKLDNGITLIFPGGELKTNELTLKVTPGELIEKQAKLAEAAAKITVDHAEGLEQLPKQLRELQQQIKELEKQVDSLRSEWKAAHLKEDK